MIYTSPTEEKPKKKRKKETKQMTNTIYKMSSDVHDAKIKIKYNGADANVEKKHFSPKTRTDGFSAVAFAVLH